MLRLVWQALNCLSIHATYCVIVAGASPGETKCGLWYVKTAIFNCCKLHNFITVTVVNYTIFAAIIDLFMPNKPSVAYVRELLVYVFWQKVLPYINNFTNQHRAVCQRSRGLSASAIAELFVSIDRMRVFHDCNKDNCMVIGRSLSAQPTVVDWRPSIMNEWHSPTKSNRFDPDQRSWLTAEAYSIISRQSSSARTVLLLSSSERRRRHTQTTVNNDDAVVKNEVSINNTNSKQQR